MEEGFCDLFVYNSRTDTLEITNELKNGECDLIKNIGGNIKQWAGNWEAIWDNIMLRAKIKKFQADLSIKYKTNEILEAKYVIESNDMFHKISEEVNEEFGNLDSKKIYSRFVSWYEDYYKKSCKKIKLVFNQINFFLI